jgi:hypothetical protein
VVRNAVSQLLGTGAPNALLTVPTVVVWAQPFGNTSPRRCPRKPAKSPAPPRMTVFEFAW